MKMWSGRFRQSLDPAFEKWQRSFDFDCRLLECELEASAAHARALMQAGVLSAEELESVLRGLEQIGDQAADSAEFLDDTQAEDVHHFVEKKLVALIGDAGYKLHSGRSRNEQIATDLRLYVRAGCDEISEALSKLISAFLDRAEQAGLVRGRHIPKENVVDRDAGGAGRGHVEIRDEAGRGPAAPGPEPGVRVPGVRPRRAVRRRGVLHRPAGDAGRKHDRRGRAHPHAAGDHAALRG